MSDAPPPARAGSPPAGGPAAGPLTPDRIEAVLTDFRGWLGALADNRGGEPHGSSGAEPEPVDLHTLVAQFTALRHDVNLQTKAARAATEQAAEAVKLLSRPAADPDEAARPLVKALIDVADALALALAKIRQATSDVEIVNLLWPEPVPPQPPRAGLLARVFGPQDRYVEDVRAWGEQVRQWTGLATERVRVLFGGFADGYAISLRRVEGVLRDLGLEPVECDGKPFDPESMEAVEVAIDPQCRPSGTVIEEVRRGYRRAGKLFRPALVKVAR